MEDFKTAWNNTLDVLVTAPRHIDSLLTTAPMQGSAVLNEVMSSKTEEQRRQFLIDIHKRLLGNVRLVGEAVEATSRLFRMPPVEVMSGPVVRTALEAAGLVHWVLDPKIDANTRAARIIRVQADDINRAINVVEKEKPLARTEAAKKQLEHAMAVNLEEKAKLDQRSEGIRRSPMPKDYALAELTDSGYEYTLYTHISHGTPAVIQEMHAMFRSKDGEVAGAAVLNFVYAAAQAYLGAAWLLGSYILAGDKLEELRKLLVAIHEAIGSNEDIYDQMRRMGALQ